MAKENRENAIYLNGDEIESAIPRYQEKLVAQFLHHYQKYKDNNVEFKFGDELEYTLVNFDSKRKQCKASLNSREVLRRIEEASCPSAMETWKSSLFLKELPLFQIEGIPTRPFKQHELLRIEQNLSIRRQILQRFLSDNDKAMTLAVFPRLGCHDYTLPHTEVGFLKDSQTSALYPKNVYSSDSKRIKSIGQTIYDRREGLMGINVPIYKDIKTNPAFCDGPVYPQDGVVEALPGHVYLDSTVFTGSLQITVQTTTFSKVKALHDNFIALSPIMLALSAASPIVKGYLVEVDTRWYIAGESAGDQVPPEYSSFTKYCDRNRFTKVPDYISPDAKTYNDLYTSKDYEVYGKLLAHGVSKSVAEYFTNIHSLKPMYLVSEDLQSLDEDSCLIENCQSTTWGAIRTKLPLHENEGWRLEFRVCETQLTDFENAAFVVFIVLFGQVTEHFKVDLKIPLSLVEENMATANERNAAVGSQFWFDVTMEDSPKGNISIVEDLLEPRRHKRYAIDNIMNGKSKDFCGLIPLMKKYLAEVQHDYSRDEQMKLNVYLDHIAELASGKRKTNATWMREFVTSHKEYKQDSIVTEEIQYDLLSACLELNTSKS